MFAIGNDELNASEVLGNYVVCRKCRKRHKVQFGEEILKDGTRVPSKLLAFYKCGKKSYLAGINGKKIC